MGGVIRNRSRYQIYDMEQTKKEIKEAIKEIVHFQKVPIFYDYPFFFF